MIYLFLTEDTIAGIATPLGEGGIGIIKISGKESTKIVKNIFRVKNVDQFTPRHFYLGKIYDDDVFIDEVMMVIMNKPKSYTGEDVVEIHCHGGFLVTRRILELVLKNGARLAEPGEFTKRAFLNGKIDLSQAEAIIDIISAKSELGLRTAAQQLEGRLKNSINEISEDIERIIANLEAEIDFPEEDLEILDSEEILSIILNSIDKIDKLISEADAGRISREGVNTVIIGKPNVGKSSLLNALVREDKAIVTEIPGTTRDIIEDYIQIRGVLFKIIDTAGFRETSDLVEKIGLEKTQKVFEEADLVLFVLDDTEELSDEDKNIINKLKTVDKKILIVLNKIDLKRVYLKDEVASYLPHVKIIEISALEKIGLDKLENELINLVFDGKLDINQDFTVTRTRHKNLLSNAKKHLLDAKATLEMGLTEEFLSIDLKDAWTELGKITGATIERDIIDKIFSEFCIGK